MPTNNSETKTVRLWYAEIPGWTCFVNQLIYLIDAKISGVYTCSARNWEYDSSIGGRKISMSDEITKLVSIKQNSAPGK